MRERFTARVLLFDDAGRILMMKGRLPGGAPDSAAWFTPGGGVEPGESLEDAAVREIFEETGFSTVALGPIVWVREAQGVIPTGEVVRFVESYFVARMDAAEPVRDGWAQHEVELIDDMRWLSLDEIAATTDRIFPERFRDLVGAIAEGRYPATPIAISTVTNGG